MGHILAIVVLLQDLSLKESIPGQVVVPHGVNYLGILEYAQDVVEQYTKT